MARLGEIAFESSPFCPKGIVCLKRNSLPIYIGPINEIPAELDFDSGYMNREDLKKLGEKLRG